MNNRTSPIPRRDFIARAAAMTAPLVVPMSALGRAARPAPSERIAMGLIGCGGMGGANMHNFLRMPEVQMIAVCDPDRARRNDARGRVERYYANQSDRGSFRGCEAYNDYRDLLGRADIDAVIVASPDHWHGLHVVHAARAGKDIYGEKPLSLTIGQGRAMSDAVRRYGCVFQTGSQQRSDERFRFACELVRGGRIGKVRRVICGLPGGDVTGNHPPIPPPDGFDYDLWLGPAPNEPYCEDRTHYVFRHILDYSGGKLTDWGAHHIDIAQWALGTMESGPTLVEGTGEFPRDGLWDAALHYDITCRYASGVEMLLTSRRENGVRFEGSAGSIFITRGRIDAEPKSLLSVEFGPGETRLERSPGHHRNFLDCVRLRRTPIAPIEHAHRTITIAHLGNIAMKRGRPIHWDPALERIENDAVASRMLDRGMRAPWRLA